MMCWHRTARLLLVAGVVLPSVAVRAHESAKPARAQPGGAWRAVEEWAPRAYDAAEKFSQHREWRVHDFTAVGGSLPGQPDSIDRLSERANRLREKSQEFVNKPLAKHGNLVIKYSDAAGTILGQASAGDFRGAATSMVDLGAKEASAKIGAAAGGVFFSAAGWLIGGPPGAMAGGVVGGAVGETIAESKLYQAYLAPQVKRFSQWFDPEVDGFKLALAMRRQHESVLRRLEYSVAERQLLVDRGIDRGVDAEFSLPSDPVVPNVRRPGPGDLENGAPSLPRKCTIRTAARWMDNAGGPWSNVWHFEDGKATTKGPNFKFRGQVHGNVVEGGWEWADNAGWVKERLVFHPGGKLTFSATFYNRYPNGDIKPDFRTGEGTWEMLSEAQESSEPGTRHPEQE